MDPPKLNRHTQQSYFLPINQLPDCNWTDIRSCEFSTSCSHCSCSSTTGLAKYLYKYDSYILASLQQSLQIKMDTIPICKTFAMCMVHYNYYSIKSQFAKLSFAKCFEDWIWKLLPPPNLPAIQYNPVQSYC